jgi:hypothetical protein
MEISGPERNNKTLGVKTNERRTEFDREDTSRVPPSREGLLTVERREEPVLPKKIQIIGKSGPVILLYCVSAKTVGDAAPGVDRREDENGFFIVQP